MPRFDCAFGLLTATCSHGIPPAAVNYENSGERYGYTDFLMKERSRPSKIFRSDIVCKLQPWQLKQEAAVLQSINPEIQNGATFGRVQRSVSSGLVSKGLLPDAHGQLHGLPCQVFKPFSTFRIWKTYLCFVRYNK
jgi:hypothetical protein